jgi:hypothetical protein
MYIEVFDQEGNKIKQLPAGTRKGINRVQWTPTKKPPRVPRSQTIVSGALFGPYYPPGTYNIRVVKGEDVYESSVEILHDPDSPHSREDQELQMKTVNDAYLLLEELAYTDRRITDALTQAGAHRELPEIPSSLHEALTDFTGELGNIRKKMLVTKVGDIRGEQQLREKVAELYGAVSGYRGKPTQPQIDRLADLETESLEMEKAVDSVMDKYLVSLNEQLEKEGLGKISITTPEEWAAESEED